MSYRIVERGIGRAGGLEARESRQAEWNAKYGKGKWVTGYDFDGRFYPYEEAVDRLYNRSYNMHFDAHPEDMQELCERASYLCNSHSQRTGSTDLQVPAVLKCAQERNMEIGNGKTPIDIGSTNEDTIGNKLSPTAILFLGGVLNGMTLEDFWQSEAKCLAVKED